MSLPEIKAAVMTVTNTVVGIPKSANLGYWPKSFQTGRALTTVLDHVEYINKSQNASATFPILRYFFTTTLWIPWQENGAAEKEMESLVDPIITALVAYNSLGLGSQVDVTIDDATPLFRTNAKTLYRVCDFTVNVQDKRS